MRSDDDAPADLALRAGHPGCVQPPPDLPGPVTIRERWAWPRMAFGVLVAVVALVLPGTLALIERPDNPAEGYVALVHPRSGLAARFGVSIVNAPGTVDAGYRGEVKVVLVNLDPRDAVELRRGDRIAQLVLQRVEQARFVEVDALPGSARGSGGYGSTGGFRGPDEEKQ